MCADITMCQAIKCHKKENCYRYKARITELGQAYFIEEPKQPCEYYWKFKE